MSSITVNTTMNTTVARNMNNALLLKAGLLPIKPIRAKNIVNARVMNEIINFINESPVILNSTVCQKHYCI